eukprot:m.136588 g.136588  ORF g.136588 m.136588 type:complete len:415 (+) comp11439_c0_seq7:784-2028(+)
MLRMRTANAKKLASRQFTLTTGLPCGSGSEFEKDVSAIDTALQLRHNLVTRLTAIRKDGSSNSPSDPLSFMRSVSGSDMDSAIRAVLPTVREGITDLSSIPDGVVGLLSPHQNGGAGGRAAKRKSSSFLAFYAVLDESQVDAISDAIQCDHVVGEWVAANRADGSDRLFDVAVPYGIALVCKQLLGFPSSRIGDFIDKPQAFPTSLCVALAGDGHVTSVANALPTAENPSKRAKTIRLSQVGADGSTLWYRRGLDMHYGQWTKTGVNETKTHATLEAVYGDECITVTRSELRTHSISAVQADILLRDQPGLLVVVGERESLALRYWLSPFNHVMETLDASTHETVELILSGASIERQRVSLALYSPPGPQSLFCAIVAAFKASCPGETVKHIFGETLPSQQGDTMASSRIKMPL